MRIKGDTLFVVLTGVAGILVGLMVGQVTLVRFSDDALQDYARDLLSHAVDVAQESRNTLAVVNASDERPCTPGDLRALRLLSFETENLRDVGRVRDGRIICTALWGTLTPPVLLEPPHLVLADGDALWENAENVGPNRIKVDMVVRGTAIVVTAPTAFRRHEKPADGLSALVWTHDRKYIYRAFGDTAPLSRRGIDRASWHDFAPQRVTSLCSGEVDICVTAGLADISVLRQPVPALLAVGGLGALTGSSIGLAVLFRRNGRASLPQQIRRAVAEGRLDVVYQPLRLVRTGQLVGAEALARMHDDDGNPIPTEIFIKVAEEIGVIGDVTHFVVHRTLADMAGRLRGRGDFHLGVNISVSDILDRTFIGYLRREIARVGVPPNRIVLEITERSTADHERLLEHLQDLRRDGFELFIDDFGTGYSNLAYLARLPINGIKIDRMFTEAIGKDAVSSTIVESICSIARELGLILIVEGIETQAQADYIQALHPEAIGQGWLYGKPVSVEALPEA